MGFENVSSSTSKQKLSLSCMAEASHYKDVGLETLGVEQELIPDFILLSLWGIKTCVDSPAFQIATNLWAGLRQPKHFIVG